MQTKLLKYMLDNPTKIFNQAALARFLDCSPSTVSRIIEPFVKENIVAYEQLKAQMKIIALNTESDKVKAILEFYQKIRDL